jgi:hypothetical protein
MQPTHNFDEIPDMHNFTNVHPGNDDNPLLGIQLRCIVSKFRYEARLVRGRIPPGNWFNFNTSLFTLRKIPLRGPWKRGGGLG